MRQRQSYVHLFACNLVSTIGCYAEIEPPPSPPGGLPDDASAEPLDPPPPAFLAIFCSPAAAALSTAP